MENCPDCGGKLIEPVIPEGEYPRFGACLSCSYPLDYKKLFERLQNETITEVVRGTVFNADNQALSGEEGISLLKKHNDSSWPVFEDKTAVGFRIENDILVFNFGAAGDCERYLRSDPT